MKKIKDHNHIERDPLKHRRDVLRMANEILVLIQDIVDEKSSPFLVDRSSIR